MGPPLPADEWREVRDSTGTEWDNWEQEVFRFLQSHAHGAVYPTPDPKENVTKFNAQIKLMVKIYFCLSKFVNFFLTFAQSNAKGVLPPTNTLAQRVQDGLEWSPLNEIERLRLQRGLLRYELYCRLVGLPSMAASCNRDVYGVVVFRNTSLALSELWWGNPFPELLPIDEVEEIICASIYVKGLYQGLRWTLLQDFHNRVLDSHQGRDIDLLNTDPGEAGKKTVEHWLSQTGNQILDFESLEQYGKYYWTDSMSRLGLVFLDRVCRSDLADRRELMRSAFNVFLSRQGNNCNYLWRYWDEVVNERCMWPGPEVKIGPYCNPMVQTAINNDSITTLVDQFGARRLRSLGWVFLDDKSKLRALGLPYNAKASTMRNWVDKTDKEKDTWPPRPPKIPLSALTARFTEEEWKEMVMDKYAPKDRRGDYQAMSRFVAGARAVVDLTSDRLPQID